MLKKWIIASSLIAASISSAHASFTPFSLTINHTGGLTTSQLDIFESARQYWESQIAGYDTVVNFTPGLVVSAKGQSIDGQGGVLGNAGPSSGYMGANGLTYAAQGAMNFDTADLSWLESNGRLYDVVVHELAHVIGFGTLWGMNGLYASPSGQYVGQYAVDMYQSEFGATTNFVPVERNIGPGSDDGHWATNWLGGTNELFVSYLGASPTISMTSLASFRDLGYIMSYTFNNIEVAEDVSAPIGGALILMSGMLFLQRRKKIRHV